MTERPAVMPSKGCRFCGWAHEYESDKLSRVLGDYQQKALEVLRPTNDDRFLDVGCGTGAATRKAATAVEVGVGVDACPRMIDRAQELAARLQRVDFVVATAERLPFADAVFTAVLCTSVMRHVEDRTVVVAEMARVLAPGGRVVVGDFVPELAFTGSRSARRRGREAAAASLPHPDLAMEPHIVCSSFLGPYLITHATKGTVIHGPHRRRHRALS